MSSTDAPLARLVEQVRHAQERGEPLHIVGGASREFLGQTTSAGVLRTAELSGIVSYEPTELVITARAGTRLDDINAALAEHRQMLGFEPPQLSAAATIGGAIAAGWSGPARPFRGSARDFVLGVRLLNGAGEVLRFGGQVMKNVAGYDIARLLAGSYGALGVIVDISLRVVPVPARSVSLVWPLAAREAGKKMRALAREPWPVTAMAAWPDELVVRVSGSDEAVSDAVQKLQPASTLDNDPRWQQLRDLELPALHPGAAQRLWRLSVAPAAPPPPAGMLINDWGGAQRWIDGSADAAALSGYCREHGGHATCLDRSGGARGNALAPPAPALQALMRRIKSAFDPAGIFNPGIYFGWI